jgi:hypothetical protein
MEIEVVRGINAVRLLIEHFTPWSNHLLLLLISAGNKQKNCQKKRIFI